MTAGSAATRDSAGPSGGSPLADGPAALALVTLAAAALALVGIGAESFWLDEALSVSFARLSWDEFWPIATGNQINGTLYYLLLRGWILVDGSEVGVRGLSALFAVATVPVVGVLGGRLFGRRAGVVAAVLLATHPFFIEYAQEARSYSLALLLASASSLLLVEAVPRRGGLSRAAWWAAYAVVAGLSLYAHVFAGFVVLAQAVAVLLLAPDARRAAVTAFVAVGVLGLPIAVAVLTPGNSFVSWIQPPTVGDVVRTGRVLAGTQGVLSVAYALLLLAAGVATVRGWGRRPPRERLGLVLAAGWLLAAPLVALALSPVKPLFVTRYLVVVLPGLVLLAAFALTRLQAGWRQALVVAVMLAAAGLQLVREADTTSKEEWRTAATTVLERAVPGDAVAFVAWYGAVPFDLYVTAAGPAAAGRLELVYPPGPWGSVDPVGADQPAALDALAGVPPDRRLWLVLSHEERSEGTLGGVLERLAATHEERDRIALRGIELRLFEPRSSASGG